MNKIIIAVVILAAGIAGFVMGSKTGNHGARTQVSSISKAAKTDIPFDYRAPSPSITASEVETHRERHYQDMESVDNVLELPTDFAQTEALYALAGRASITELEELIDQSIRIADRFDRAAALHVLFSRYIELDPQAAVDFLLLIDLDIDARIIKGAFQSWAKADLHGAIARANQIDNFRQRKHAGGAILVAVARADPGMLETVAAQLIDSHKLEYLQSESVGTRANYDPETALQEALKLGSVNGRWEAIRRVGIVWARNDPKTAISFAQSINNQQLREQFIRSVLDQWIGDDPEAAMQNILANPNSHERNQYLRRGLTIYAGSDPAHAITLAAQLAGREKELAYQEIFSIWAAQDPISAMQEYAALENYPAKRNLLTQIGQTLVNSDPEAALRWLDMLNAGDRLAQLPNVLSQLAQVNPQRALELARASERSGSGTKVLSSVLQHVGYMNPQLAVQYLSEVPAGSERDILHAMIAKNWATKDPQAALAWVSTLSGQAYVQAVSGVAGNLANNDPNLAASMIRQLPETARSAVIQSTSISMSYRDPRQALDWLSQFSSNASYDTAVITIVARLARQDPQYAARWATSQEGEQRTQAVGSVSQAWASSDPAAASRWVQSLRSGEAKDRALISLALSTRFTAHETSAFINALSSDTHRDRAIVMAYVQLRRESDNDAAANELLDRVDASDAIREQILQSHGN